MATNQLPQAADCVHESGGSVDQTLMSPHCRVAFPYPHLVWMQRWFEWCSGNPLVIAFPTFLLLVEGNVGAGEVE